METDDPFQLFDGSFGTGLHRFQVGNEIVGHFKTDGLQDLRFRLNVIVEARRLHTHVLRQIPHGGRAESLFPEKPGSFFDDHILLAAVLFASDLCHIKGKDKLTGVSNIFRQLYTRWD